MGECLICGGGRLEVLLYTICMCGIFTQPVVPAAGVHARARAGVRVCACVRVRAGVARCRRDGS